MQFKTLTLAALAATIAAANTVDMVSQDSVDRSIHFVPQTGSPEIDTLSLPGGQNKTATFPTGWVGNWYAVSDGTPDPGKGMLGEIRWDGWNGLNFFDVSAIVAPQDVHGVKELFPKNAKTPLSGCQTFPCDNCYNLPDDVATMATTETELVCLIGDLPATKRRHARDVLYI